MMRKPNFLYLGAPKAGSTWAYNILQRHPLAFVPAAKDIYFFDRNYNRGHDWYLRHFQRADERHEIIGEFSHDYLYSPVSAARIREFSKDIKLVAVLRNPIDRAVSEIGFFARNGENVTNLDRLIDHYPEIIEKSLYTHHVKRFDEVFSPNRVHVLFYDDLQENPSEFAATFFDLLGLPPLSGMDVGARANAAAQPRAKWLARGAKKVAVGLRELGATELVGRVKASRVVKRMLYQSGSPDLSAHRETLVRKYGDIFLNDISALQEYLGRALPDWRRSLGAIE